MTTIKTSCPVCGDVELTPAQMRLVVCSRSEWSFYAFLCGTCQDEIRKPADDEVVTLLVSGGVVAEQWLIPAEALEEHHGATITYDVREGAPTSAPPLFIIGSPMGADGFVTLSSHFADRTVLTYDPRGVGRSPKDDPLSE